MRLPLPGSAPHEVAAPAPGAGPGFWSGSSTAALEPDGSYAIAYRVRNGHEGNALNVIARSEDGATLTTVAELDESHFGAMSIERPALVRTEDGRWRMYVCLATPGSKHWWIGALEADDLEGLAGADVRTAFPGDETIGVKDPVIWRDDAGWHGLICCHLLDIPDHEDRMDTRYATSPDGLEWTWRGTVLSRDAGHLGRARRAAHRAAAGRARRLRRPRDRRGELVRAHRARAARRRRVRGAAGRPDRRRPLPRRRRAAGRRVPDLLRVPAARRLARAAHGAHRIAAAGAAVISGTPNASTSSPASGRSSAQSAFTVRITAFDRAAVRRPCSW